ncbi:MAG: VTT domain-containing protein [candidate division SR1 bacterium]|nr:VTT domain-containing protein [candidate division SR1 bacterium]
MDGAVVLLLKYKYLIMLALMIMEGPAVAFVSAFMAAQGIFSFGLVYLFSIIGDLIGDLGWYRVGRFARRSGATELLEKEKQGIKIDKKVLKRRARFGLRVATKIYKLEKKSVFNYIHEKMNKNFFLALFIVKVTPPLSAPGHLAFGFFKIPFRKFFTNTLILCFLLESIFLNLGYFSSMSINTFKNNLDVIGLTISIVVIGGIALLAAFFIIKRIRKYSRLKTKELK